MSEDRNQLWLGLCLVGGMCAYIWFWYIRSIIFYRKNGFDFSKDFGPNAYLSRYAHDRFLASPKVKFFVVMPIMLLGTSFLLIFIILRLI